MKIYYYIDALNDHVTPMHNDSYLYLLILKGKGSFTCKDSTIEFDSRSIIEIPENSDFILSYDKRIELGFIELSDTIISNTKIKYYSPISTEPVFKTFFYAIDICSYPLINPDIIENAIATLLFNAINTIGISFSSANPVIHRVIKDITDNYSDPDYSLSDVISSTGYSKSYFRKLFFEETGLSPHTFLMMLRLDTAANQMIRDKNSSIREIAKSCGFSDPYYFSRAFKKEKGCSPKEYIQKNTPG